MSNERAQANGNLTRVQELPSVAAVPAQERSLGLLVSSSPTEPGFRHALELARAALKREITVYWYAVDEGVRAVDTGALRDLVQEGIRLFACAYGAERRRLPHHPHAVYAGLGVVSDLMSRTDRFLCFA